MCLYKESLQLESAYYFLSQLSQNIHKENLKLIIILLLTKLSYFKENFNIIDNFEHFMLIYQNIFNFAIMVFELYYININYL